MMEWRNQVAVVTGGSRGIGRATVRLLARFAHQRAGELLAALIADAKAEEVKEHAALIEAFKPILALRQTAQDCARDAANYVHPKLASVQHGSDPDNPLDTVTDADRAQVIVAFLAENPKLLDQILKQLT
jgi:NAD(P)-dependent dehydrogenase (short-subunit alcohol dehydrogenase family)